MENKVNYIKAITFMLFETQREKRNLKIKQNLKRWSCYSFQCILMAEFFILSQNANCILILIICKSLIYKQIH